MKQKHKEAGIVIIKKKGITKERKEWLNLEKKVEMQVLFSALANIPTVTVRLLQEIHSIETFIKISIYFNITTASSLQTCIYEFAIVCIRTMLFKITSADQD